MKFAFAILVSATVLLTVGCSKKTQGIEAVKETLFDPSSAQFRNVHDGVDRKDGWIVCGEVNAKNRLGGYTGFKRFAVTEKKGDVMFADPNKTEGILAAALIQGICKFPD